jgi:Tfp pilus assembly protein PilP
MNKITYFVIIICVLLSFMGCKKEQPSLKRQTAREMQPPLATAETKEPEETKKIVREVYNYDARGKRDPFLSLVAVTKKKPERKQGVSPFESFSVDEITLSAIAWDNQQYYALITFPDKKSYTITVGTKLGLYGGKVQEITEDSVTIREYIKDFRGDIKPKDTTLKLRKEEEE